MAERKRPEPGRGSGGRRTRREGRNRETATREAFRTARKQPTWATVCVEPPAAAQLCLPAAWLQSIASNIYWLASSSLGMQEAYLRA